MSELELSETNKFNLSRVEEEYEREEKPQSHFKLMMLKNYLIYRR